MGGGEGWWGWGFKPDWTKLREDASDHQRVPTKTCHCGICLEFRLVAKYKGSPCINQWSNYWQSCRCKNYRVKQKNLVGEGGSQNP